MTIKYILDAQGGFTCGDTETKITSYAYPTSASASQAKHSEQARLKVAIDMLHRETRHGFAHEIDYDHRNWTKLSS